MSYVLIVSSSSSEYESDGDEEIEQTLKSTPPLHETNKQVYSLVRWMVIFVRLWQALFTISDAAIELLVKCFCCLFSTACFLDPRPFTW